MGQMVERNGLRADLDKWRETQRRSVVKQQAKRSDPSRSAVRRGGEGEQAQREQKPLWTRTPEQREARQREVDRQAAVPKNKSSKGKRGGDFTPATRAVIYDRSGGYCEVRLTGCLGEGTQVHHRKLRRHKDHRVVNGLHVCGSCHMRIHAGNPEASEEGWDESSEKAGWLVPSWLDPANVPVRLHLGTVLLAEDFGYRAVAA